MDKQYPRGKLREDDDGACPVSVGIDNNAVVIDFGKPVCWIGMDKNLAIELANCILEKANLIKLKVENV